MTLCLLEMATVKDQGTSEEWTDLIDRGGLCHALSFSVSSLESWSQHHADNCMMLSTYRTARFKSDTRGAITRVPSFYSLTHNSKPQLQNGNT